MAALDLATIVNGALRKANMGPYAGLQQHPATASASPPQGRDHAASASASMKAVRHREPARASIPFPRCSPCGLPWEQPWPMPDGELPTVVLWGEHVSHRYKDGTTRLVGPLGHDGGEPCGS